MNETIVLPLQHPTLFLHPFRSPFYSILMFGPPGTGKSHLARCIAGTVGAYFMSLSAADLLSKWTGESEKALSSLFREATELASRSVDAGEGRGVILFFDEIDAICSARADGESDGSRRMKTQFLVELTKLSTFMEESLQKFRASKTDSRFPCIFVIAATNLPWDLDPAVRRRFHQRVLVPLPDAAAIKSLLIRFLAIDAPRPGVVLSPAEVDSLADSLKTFSGSDVEMFCREVVMLPVRMLPTAPFFLPLQCGDDTLWVPLDTDAEGAIPRDELNTDSVVPNLAADSSHCAAVLQYFRASVGTADQERHDVFQQQCGTASSS